MWVDASNGGRLTVCANHEISDLKRRNGRPPSWREHRRSCGECLARASRRRDHDGVATEQCLDRLTLEVVEGERVVGFELREIWGELVEIGNRLELRDGGVSGAGL